MSYNGSGVWTANSTGLPVVTGTTISSTMFNAFTSDVATGLSTAVCKDGQQTITANIPLSSFKLTGLAAGSTSGDSVRYEQVLLLTGGTVTGGEVVTGTVGGSGIGRTDAQIEFRNGSGTGHAMLSSVLTQNPGNTTNENAWSGAGYGASGTLVQMGAAYMHFIDTNETNGYTVIGLHPNYFSGGIRSDVCFEVYGAHGIGMFLGASPTPPLDRYLLIKRTNNRPSIAGVTDLAIDANYAGSADTVFLQAYNAGNVNACLGGGAFITTGVSKFSGGTGALASATAVIGISATKTATVTFGGTLASGSLIVAGAFTNGGLGSSRAMWVLGGKTSDGTYAATEVVRTNTDGAGATAISALSTHNGNITFTIANGSGAQTADVTVTILDGSGNGTTPTVVIA